MATLGQRVKELREKASLTQSELAEAVGFKSTRALQYVEADQRGTSHSTLISLAEYFNVSIDYLVGRTDNPQLHK
jgi:transcriptional regulator with XRE-family HTH domain